MRVKEIIEIRDYLDCSFGELRIDQREKLKMLCEELLRYKKQELSRDLTDALAKKFGNIHLKGFKYLQYILENYSYPVHGFINMYKNVAREFGTNWGNVERCIRNFIYVVCDKNITVSKFISKQLIEFGRVGKDCRIVLEDTE